MSVSAGVERRHLCVCRHELELEHELGRDHKSERECESGVMMSARMSLSMARA